MSNFFEDTMQGLLEALEIENGNIPLIEKENMPATTYMVATRDKELIDQMINLRKEQNISQRELAKMTGNKQQAISRMEKKEHSPSLKTFSAVLNALGYELQIVKQVNMV